MTHINRRKALTVVAAAPAAVALPTIAQGNRRDDAEEAFGEFGGGPRSYMQRIMTDSLAPEYPKGSIFIIDPDRTPKDGDLVHVHWRFSKFGLGSRDFSNISAYDAANGGHDLNGRFCPRGSPNEAVASIAPLRCSRKDFDEGFVTILGTVCAVVARLYPVPDLAEL